MKKKIQLIFTIIFGTITYPFYVVVFSMFGITFPLCIILLIIKLPQLFGNNPKDYYQILLILVYPFIAPIIMWKNYYETGEFSEMINYWNGT